MNNWDKYQHESTNTLTNKQPTDNQQITTIEEGNKERRKEYSNSDEVYMQAWHLSITHDEFTKLEKEFWMEKADELISQVLNYRKNSKYKSLYLTALKWWKQEKKKNAEPVKTVRPTFNFLTWEEITYND